MNRRSLFSAVPAALLGIGPAIAAMAAQASAPEGFERVSCDKDDPGYRAFAMLNGDGKKFQIMLDGIEVQHCITADARDGWVKRLVTTPAGNIAISFDDVLTEIVHGRVEIIIT